MLCILSTDLKTMENGNDIIFDSDEIQICEPITAVSFTFTQTSVTKYNFKIIFVNVKSSYFFDR